MSGKAVIYARYSSAGQREESIEQQIAVITGYAKRNGYTIVRKAYIDKKKTGTTDNREDFQRMIADAEKLKFDTILIYKIDRFARNRYDSAFYKNRLKKFSVKVVSVSEPISDDPSGIITEALLEGMAEYYA